MTTAPSKTRDAAPLNSRSEALYQSDAPDGQACATPRLNSCKDPRPNANTVHEGKQPATELVKQTEPDRPLLPSWKVGWLARVTGSKSPAAPPRRPLSEPALMQPTETQAPVPTTYGAKHYNWSSFFCPYCKASGFVKCGGGHLVCDGNVEIRHGKRFHHCYCGKAGFISGVIEAFECNQSDFPIPSDEVKPSSPGLTKGGSGESDPIALPPSISGVPSRSRRAD